MSDSRHAAPVVLAHEPSFRLGTLELRPATREAVGADFRELVEPRVMQVMVALARAGGTVVSREDLTASCWEGRVVSEDAINRVISLLRRLGERAGGKAFTLETITRVGYRLAPAPAASRGEPAEIATSGAASAGRPRLRARVSWLVLALVITIAAGWLLWPPSGPSQVAGGVDADYERAHTALAHGTPDDIAHAVALLQSVVERAPNFADGWGLLAHAYFDTLDFVPLAEQDGLIARVKSAIARAQALEPDNAEAKAAEALSTLFIRHWSEAEALQDEALAALPDDPDLLEQHGLFLLSTGRGAEGLGFMEHAAAVDPDSPRAVAWLAHTQTSQGQIEEADRTLDRAIQTWPRNISVYFTRFWIDVFSGRAQQALDRLADLDKRPIGAPDEDFATCATVARAFATGKAADIDRAIAEQRAIPKKGLGYAMNAIQVLAALGDLDGAFALGDAMYLGKGGTIFGLIFSRAQGEFAVRNRRPVFVLFGVATASMRRDMRFVALVEGLDLGAYWRSTGKWPNFCAGPRAEPAAGAVCAALKAGPATP